MQVANTKVSPQFINHNFQFVYWHPVVVYSGRRPSGGWFHKQIVHSAHIPVVIQWVPWEDK